MSSIINKILGKNDDSHHHHHHHGTSHGPDAVTTTVTGEKHGDNHDSTTTTTVADNGPTVNENGHVMHGDGVTVRSTVSSDTKSTVSMKNQQKLSNLLSKLGKSSSLQ